MSDPDAYFAKRTEYEAQASSSFNEFTEETRATSTREAELARREQLIASFNEGRQIPITNDVVQNDVPPKFLAELEAGTVTFDQFLVNVASFVDAPKTANARVVTNVANLSDVAGGTSPSKDGNFEQDLAQNYANLVF